MPRGRPPGSKNKKTLARLAAEAAALASPPVAPDPSSTDILILDDPPASPPLDPVSTEPPPETPSSSLEIPPIIVDGEAGSSVSSAPVEPPVAAQPVQQTMSSLFRKGMF